jgi:hypothetical protein
MTPVEYVKMFFIAIVILSLGILVFVMGRYAGDKNNLDNVQSSLNIIGGSVFAVLAVIALASYFFIRTHPGAFVPMTLFLMYLNLQLSLMAVGTSVIQKT